MPSPNFFLSRLPHFLPNPRRFPSLPFPIRASLPPNPNPNPNASTSARRGAARRIRGGGRGQLRGSGDDGHDVRGGVREAGLLLLRGAPPRGGLPSALQASPLPQRWRQPLASASASASAAARRRRPRPRRRDPRAVPLREPRGDAICSNPMPSS